MKSEQIGKDRYNRRSFEKLVKQSSLRDAFKDLREPGIQIRERYNQLNIAQGHRSWEPVAYMAGGYGDAGDLARRIKDLEIARMNHADKAVYDARLSDVRHELGDLVWVATVIAETYALDPIYPEQTPERLPADGLFRTLDVIGAGGVLAKSVMAAEQLRQQRTSGSLQEELSSRLGGYIASLEQVAEAYDINPVAAFLDTMDELHARIDAGRG